MISPTRLLRYATRFAAWITPHVQRWRRQRHEDRVEGERHLAAKNYSEAEKHLFIALELAEQRHVSTAKRNELRLELAEAQREQKKLDEAERNVQIAMEAAGRDQSLKGNALEGLADLQTARGDLAEAEKSIREAVESSAKMDALARRTGKLARVVYRQGRGEDAIEIYERAADLYEEAFGGTDARTAALLGEMGALHRHEGNHAKAQEYLQQALKIHEAASGANSLEASESLAQLASSLEESGDMDGAMAQYERVLRMKERQVGGSLEDMADMQARAARMYLHWGERGKARQLLAQALPQLARNPGHKFVEALETMAALEEASGRMEDAARYREHAQSVGAQL